MKSYREMSNEELKAEIDVLMKEYRQYQNMDLKLNMSRGKPCLDQLDLSMGLMDVLSSEADMFCEDGTDCRNYGVLDGIEECKELIGDMMENRPDNIIIYGNSSLNVMYDTVSRAMTHGIMGNTPWCKLDRVKFLCPVPGYDRHFAITEYFGIEMIPVPMSPTGPDMAMVEKLVSTDEQVKGIWCVPKYSNPQGYSYSDETVRRFARLKPAAKDFRIFWDNASKITFPGSGISALATSPNNLEDIRSQLAIQTIGHDKVNQLRHVRFFGDIHGMVKHMHKHAEILRPKFEAVEEILDKNLSGLDIGSWTKPKGGYFISFDAMPGCAKEIVAKAKKAGVEMTKAGATWPYGRDPYDSNIRIAPSYPPLNDLKTATELFSLVVRIVSARKILDNRDKAE